MNINADFARRTAVHTAEVSWVPSPVAGVERRMLDRLGGELARATTIVRYAPGSRFSAHVHTGGEEFIVLDGVFQDEHGDYPAGTYVRNPPTTHHTPRADKGATILVKLWQFDPADRQSVRIDTHAHQPVSVQGRNGVGQIPLFRDSRENVRIEIWEPGATIRLPMHKGLEIFVLDGAFAETGERFSQHDWLRLPAGHGLDAIAGSAGARLWVKSDHLGAPQRSPGEAP